MRKLIFPTLAAAVLVSACSPNDQLTTNNASTPQTYAAAKYGVDIKPIAGGGFIILGNTSNSIAGGSSSDTERDFVLIKTDADGNVIWTRTITDNTTDDVAKRVIVLPNNAGFALAGTSRAITTSGGVATFGKQQAVIQTFDAAGTPVSSVVANSNASYDFDATALNVMANGDLVIASATSQVTEKVPVPQADTRDIMVTCFDASLNRKWNQVAGFAGEDTPIEVAEASNGVAVWGRSKVTDPNNVVSYQPVVMLLNANTGNLSNILQSGTNNIPANFYPTAATYNASTNSALVAGYVGTPSSSTTTDVTLLSVSFNNNAITWGTPTQLSSFGTNLGYTGEMPVSIQAAGTGYVIASKAQRGTVTEAHLIRLSSTLSLQWDMLFGTLVASDEGAAAVPVLDVNGTVTHVAMVGTFDVAVNPTMFFVKASN